MKFVSVPELAEILALSAATVRTRIKSGEWPHYGLGERSIRLDVDEIKQLLRTPARVAKVNNSRAKSKRPSLTGILANQHGEVMGLRGEIEKGPPPRRKR